MNATGTGFGWGVRRVRGIALALVLLFLLAGAGGYFIRALTAPTTVTHIASQQPAAAGAAAPIAPAVDPVGDGHRQSVSAPAQVDPVGDGHRQGVSAPAAPANPAGDGHLAY